MHTATFDRRAQAFWDRIAPKYARKPLADQAAYEEKLAAVRSKLADTDRVLEIGCGTGSTALNIADRAAHITAADVSPGMLAIARGKLLPGAPENVTFVQAEATSPVEGSPFDAVCAFSLLHLTEDLPAVLANVHNQLKPGGLFFSKTACLRDGWFMIRALVRVLTAVGIAPHVSFYSVGDIERQLRNAGFDIEEVRYFGKGRMSPFVVARRAA